MELKQLIEQATPLPWNTDMEELDGLDRRQRELVVRAVNMLPKLVEALENLSAAVSAMTGMTSDEPSPFLSEAGKEAFARNKDARAVLAEATEVS